MSTPVTFNGVGYTIPETNEVNWGDEVTNWIVAVSDGTIQQDGGTFTLTADIVLADFGLQSDYIITPSIQSASGVDIEITPGGTGNVALGNFSFDADQSVGAGQDNYVLTYNNSTGLISLETIPSSTTFKAASGSAATPSYSFSSDTDTGMFLSGGPGLEFSVSSHLVLDLREDDIRVKKTLLMQAGGSASAPDYSFENDPDNGIFYPATNSIGFSTAGTERVRIEADGTMRVYATNYETLVTGDDDIPNKKYVDDVAAAIGFPQFIELTDAPSSYASGSANKLVAVNSGEDGVEFVERTLMADGAVGAPAYSFESAATSGMYYYGGSSIKFAWGGVECFSIDTSNVSVSASTFNFPQGTEAIPGCRFYGDVNTGIYWPGADSLAISTGGVGRFQIESNGTLVVLTTDYETLVTADDDIPNKKYVDDAVAGGVGVSQLSDLDDVFDATATNGYVLVAGGLTWQSQALTESLISDLGNYIESVYDDPAPTLAGDLVVNGFAIKSLSNGDIAITPNGTGDLILDGLKWPQADGSADQVLKTNGSGQLSWVDQSTELSDLSDVGVTTPTNRNVLVADGDSWESRALVEADISDLGSYLTSVQLSDLSDVGVTTPTNRNVLVADGDSWESRALVEADISDLGSYLTDITGESIDDLSDVTVTSLGDGEVLVSSSGTWINQTLAEAGIQAAGSYLENVSDDSTPALAGSLDVNGHAIVSTSDGDIELTPDGTGKTKVTNLEAPVPINNQTGTSYELVLADAGKIVTLSNASAITLTVPAAASKDFDIGTQIELIQLGAGQVTVTITSDTLNYNADFTNKLAGQYSKAVLEKLTSTMWVLSGDLEGA